MAEDIIGAVIALIIIIPLSVAMINAFSGATSDTATAPYKVEISNLQGQIQTLQGQVEQVQAQSTYYKDQYETLRTTNITKKDFTDLQGSINQLNIQVSNLYNRTIMINQNIMNYFDIKNTYNSFAVSLAVNIAFTVGIGLYLTLFKFSLHKIIINRLRKRKKESKK